MALTNPKTRLRSAGLFHGFLDGLGSMAFLAGERRRPVTRRPLTLASADRARIQGDFARVLNSNREFPARG